MDGVSTAVCTLCKKARPLAEFGKRSDGANWGRRSGCRLCLNAKKREWQRQNPEKAVAIRRRHYYSDHQRQLARATAWSRANPTSRLATHLMRAYGITLPQYQEMLDMQGGGCAACGNPETAVDGRTGRVRRLHVDHDHATGAVRGLLCTNCNLALGYLKDDLGRIANLLTYMTRRLERAGIPHNVVMEQTP